MYRFQSIEFILISGTPPIGSARPLICSVRPLIVQKTCRDNKWIKYGIFFRRIATILYFGDWNRHFLQSMISHKNLKTHKLVPSLLLAPCHSLLVLRSHDVPSSIKFFCFALLKLSRFRSNPSVCGNCPKVRERKGNFT